MAPGAGVGLTRQWQASMSRPARSRRLPPPMFCHLRQASPSPAVCSRHPAAAVAQVEHYGVAWTVGDLMSDPEFAQDAQDIIDATCRMPNMDDCIITPIEPSTWGGIKERILK